MTSSPRLKPGVSSGVLDEHVPYPGRLVLVIFGAAQTRRLPDDQELPE